jgi:hypothetical protein
VVSRADHLRNRAERQRLGGEFSRAWLTSSGRVLEPIEKNQVTGIQHIVRQPVIAAADAELAVLMRTPAFDPASQI